MKMWNYVFIAIGLAFLFEFAGITPEGSGILSLIGFTKTAGVYSWNFTLSTFWNGVLGATGLWVGIGVGIAIGFVTRSSPENFIILPFITGTLGIFIQSYIAVMTYSFANAPFWVTAILILTVGPFIPMFVFSVVEFFRGTD